jgi:hypothetical protein
VRRHHLCDRSPQPQIEAAPLLSDPGHSKFPSLSWLLVCASSFRARQLIHNLQLQRGSSPFFPFHLSSLFCSQIFFLTREKRAQFDTYQFIANWGGVRKTFSSKMTNSTSQSPPSSSLSGMVSTLIPTLLVALVYVSIFLVLRRSQRRFYAPRTYLGTMREQ